MEPRPPSRRDAPATAPPPTVEPNGQPPVADGDYGATVQFDPYTAPEAQSAYGPTAGYPGDSATRLGPLADEPVFYPNPGLPPNRPAYQPQARYDARSEYALHPVGRVPPDHQPLNLRPAPPPMPPAIAAPENNNLIKGILAAVIGLVAVIALVAAFLAFANGGFGRNDASPPTAAPIIAGQPSGAAGAADSSPSSAGASRSPGGGAVLPPPVSQAPSAGASEAAGADASPASARPSTDSGASTKPSAGSSAEGAGSNRARTSRSASDNAEPANAGDISDYLPQAAAMPVGFDVPTEEGDRSLTEVAATFVLDGEDATQAETDLESWGWVDNQFISYDAAPQPPDEDINRYAVSVHEFETAGGASDALPAFVDAFGAPTVDLPASDEVGDEIVAMQTTNLDGNLVVLYVRTGQYLLKIDAASVSGDPLQPALDFAGQLVG